MAQRRLRLLLLVTLALLAVGLLLTRHRLPFSFGDLARALASVSLAPVALGLALIYAGYVLRSVRWAMLLSRRLLQRPEHASPLATLAPQLIGFTASNLFGHLADFVRPWLIARRLETSVATQLAVYSVERVLDLAAAAVLIASPLLLGLRSADAAQLHVAQLRTAQLALVAVAGLTAGTLLLRFAAPALNRVVARVAGAFSARLATRLTVALADLGVALASLSAARLGAAGLVSLLMWGFIAASYVLCAHACRSSSELAQLSFAAAMPVLAASLGGSLLQLPVLGWFTQVGVLALALHGTAHVPSGPATVCGIVIVLVVNLSVLPGGLLAARRTGVHLREVARQSRLADGSAGPLARIDSQ